MTIRVIKMPDIGEGIAEVEVVAWHVKPGDEVREDQVLAEVMTDKATVEIPSPITGRVVSLHGEVGETMAVGAELIRLEAQGKAGSGEAPSSAAAAGTARGAVESAPVVEHAPAVELTPATGRAAAPAAAVAGAGHGANGLQNEPASKAPAAYGSKPLASPSVRRHARELDIDLYEVPGSGPGGRIVHADLDAWAARAAAPVSAPARAPAALAHAAAYAERTDEEQVPIVGLRRRIAQRMQESKRRIPHFSYVEEVDVTELEALRGQLNARHGAQHGKLTLLPFVVRALVLGLRDFPQINARFDDEAGVVTRFGAVHVGVAAQTEQGLVVPVLRHAEARDLWSNATEIARLAEAARSGRATRNELSGSTITITSLGALGGIVTTPVINHPEVAIVGVNRIVERPMIRAGAVVARKMMNLSSSFDHRVIDGMHAAEFVQALRALLECPALLFVEPRS
jgi:2-oxoisovalerate dehydrogenase E2 component (dihydrolipoyl transacylase)